MFREDDKCECGGQGMVPHVLVNCPLLQDLRRELRRKAEDAIGDLPLLLGGKGENGKRKSNSATRTSTVNAVLGFAEASHRFRSRAPEGQPGIENGN